MGDTSLVHVPFDFFLHLFADEIGLVHHTSLFKIQSFLRGSEIGFPIPFKGTHVLFDDLTHPSLEEGFIQDVFLFTFHDPAVEQGGEFIS